MNPSTITRLTLASSASAVLALLAGCAGYSPGDLGQGAAESQIIARMGPPTDRAARPDGGSRLEYARGPFGKHTYRIELDAQGRVQTVSQILTEANFEALPIGAPQAEVRDRLGRPSETRVGWRGVGEVWSYRYDSAPFCKWFQVWLVEGRVREAAYAVDPVCDENRRFPGDTD
jgi:hypothetical protein